MARRARMHRATPEIHRAAAPPIVPAELLPRLVKSSLPMAVPAVVFLVMNLISFAALRRISATLFALLQQSKLIATAVLSRVTLKRRISATQWRVLFILLFSMLTICQQTHSQASHATAATMPKKHKQTPGADARSLSATAESPSSATIARTEDPTLHFLKLFDRDVWWQRQFLVQTLPVAAAPVARGVLVCFTRVSLHTHS